MSTRTRGSAWRRRSLVIGAPSGRYGAAELRGSRRGGPHHPRRLQRGLVSSRALSADAGQPRAAGRQDRQYRSAPHRHQRGRRSAAFDPARHGQRALLLAAGPAACRCAVDYDFVETHATGFDEALFAARRIAPDIETVAEKTGLSPPDDIATFVRWFIIRDKVVTCYSQGVNQSAQVTRSIPSSIAIWPAPESAGRAAGRCR